MARNGNRSAGQGGGSGRTGLPPLVPLTEVAGEEAQARRTEVLDSLPAPVRKRVEGLERLDREASQLEVEFRRERRDLERKFEALYGSVYSRRSALATRGDEDAPMDMDVVASPGRTAVTASEGGVPGFWLSAMKNSVAIAASITEQDDQVLASLCDIRCDTLPESEGVGFRLKFVFLPNEFFTDTDLSKTYYLVDTDDVPVLKKARGTEIQWKPGRDVTSLSHQPDKGQKKSTVQAEPSESFFHFFATPRLPERSDEAVDPEAFEQRIDEIESDYDLGCAFKEKIVPHAVRWFTREADDADEFSDSSQDEEEEEDEDEKYARTHSIKG